MKSYLGWIFGILAGSLMCKRLLKVRRFFQEKRAPNFYFRASPEHEIGVPVFTYHSIGPQSVPDSVTAQEFENDLLYLKQNGYTSLSSDEFIAYLTQGHPLPEKAVVLTFDDGRASLWTQAFPLLEKYQMKVISFLIPGVMSEVGVREQGDHKLSLVDLGDSPNFTWEEARRMHASGLVDFQSHTLQHATVFISPEIIDFVQPHFGYGYHHFGVPALAGENGDQLYSEPPLGTPIYRYQPRMGAGRRFYDDPGLREACVDYVSNQGGSEFFQCDQWKQTLLAVAERYRQERSLDERFETEAEQAQAIEYSLRESKHQIEAHLPGHSVSTLAYPWNHFSGLAIAKAIEVGYRGAFVDINSRKFPLRSNNPYLVDALLPANIFGDDPFLVTRLDARDRLVQSLPGEGRLTYRKRVIEKILEPPAWAKRK